MNISIGKLVDFPVNPTLILIILWLFGILLGLSYLILPGYALIIMLALCAIFVVGILKPEYTFYLFILILVEEMVNLFISIQIDIAARFYPYIFPLLVTIIGLMLARVTGRYPKRKTTPLDNILLVVVAYEILSIIWAPKRLFGLLLSLSLLTNLLLFYISPAVITNKNILRRSVHIWIISGLITTTGLILSQWIDVATNIYFSKEVGIQLAFQKIFDRPSGLAGVDHAAGFINMAIALSLGVLIYEENIKRKSLYIFLILYMIYGIILTQSRGALIGLMGAYIFFVYMHPYFKGKFIKYSFLWGLVIVFIVLLVKPSFIDRMMVGFGYRGQLLFSEKESYHGTGSQTKKALGVSGMEIRKIWWNNGLKEMVRKPLKLIFGLGIGGFMYYSAYSDRSPEVNSISFAFFYDMGIFGIILFIIFSYILIINLYYYLKNAEKTYSYYILLAATTALIADPGIHGLIDYDLTSYGSKFFWFPLGFSMAVLNIVKTEKMESQGQLEE